ncbi:hypothetical protein [Streptomyces aidingensis]|uniref:Glycolipid-binding n=1 Tax=Streptomyces aidingensis TaxID=910347 RepID=A0A1I1GIP0_9ACTN|nr:hypothetical protein [Streptomyces aidingensis]SFC11305.1 hypothetical protein SAMN05421773_1023 [Streptomyces aidingensis]
MPSGRYLLHDPHDRTPLGEERFQCAPGPSGWRYTARRLGPDGRPAGSLDLTVDQRGRPLRLEARAGRWQLRGAALDGLSWVRTGPGGEHAEPGNARAHAFTGGSPAHLVAVARLLRLTPGGPAARVRLLALTEPVLAPRTVDQSWTLLSSALHRDAAAGGELTVEEYRIDDLESGERGLVHLTGDIVLAAPGIELDDLDAPPSDWPTAAA